MSTHTILFVTWIEVNAVFVLAVLAAVFVDE